MFITDPWFYVVAVPAVLLTALSKGGFAGAFSGVAVPLMALAIPPQQAAAIMLPILIAMDFTGLAVFMRIFSRKVLATMIVGGVLGTVLGTVAFGQMDEHVLRILLGLIAIAFPLMNWLGVGATAPPLAASQSVGLVASTVSAFTSFIAHSGGPPVLIYLMAQRLEKSVLVATIAVFFTFINLIKLPPYYALGQLNFTNIGTALLLAPLAAAGVRLGFYLQGKVSEKWVYRIGRVGLFVTGLHLLYQGIFL